jgi:hypothetical protein
LHLQYIFLILNKKKKIGKERKEEKNNNGLNQNRNRFRIAKSPIQNHNHGFINVPDYITIVVSPHENEILRSQSHKCQAVYIYFTGKNFQNNKVVNKRNKI